MKENTLKTVKTTTYENVKEDGKIVYFDKDFRKGDSYALKVTCDNLIKEGFVEKK